MIDPALAAFLEEGLGIHLGTRDDRLEPNGVRANAVKVDADGTHVVVYVPEVAAPRVVPDLEANGQLALSLARPTDDRACQVKGVFVGVRPAADEERGFVEAQWQRFFDNLTHIGITRATTAGWIAWPSVAIRVRVTAVFTQTPGPDAGAPIA